MLWWRRWTHRLITVRSQNTREVLLEAGRLFRKVRETVEGGMEDAASHVAVRARELG